MNQDDWHGSFLVVDQNGRVVTRLWEPPYEVTVEGDGPLTLRVVGLPKDLLGPCTTRTARAAEPGSRCGTDRTSQPRHSQVSAMTCSTLAFSGLPG